MATITCDESHGRRAARVLGAAAVLLGLCVAALSFGGSTDATAAKAKRLGETKRTPAPDCPTVKKDDRIVDKCTAVGSITGFQVRADGKKSLFEMPRDGTIVAWSVRLSKPNSQDRKFFAKRFSKKPFGGDPTGRIGVLKKKKKKGTKYKLVRQSPVVNLAEHYGETPIITLDKPLRAKKGQIIALTTPTWIPAFHAGGSGNLWRGSRNKCGAAKALSAKPQQKVGSSRGYGCVFSDRLLYWAYYSTS